MQLPNFNAPITEIIQQRFSCRMYKESPIAPGTQRQLADFIAALPPGPFGSTPRFHLVAASKSDHNSLRGLGTYGFIRGAMGFIIGAMRPSKNGLEDFGYLMELIILHATSLDLGTCWLGGTFTKSSFSHKIALERDEEIPAATAIGEIGDPDQARQGLIRRMARGFNRLPWENLFFAARFGNPLSSTDSDQYSTPLEMVRRAPSASNKQPWRVVRDGPSWHFYLQRTPGYYEDPLKRFLGLCDLQRLDMGIAMCHFELACREMGLHGHWEFCPPEMALPDALTEYTVSWIGEPQNIIGT